jgi:hypothetical protein
LVALIVLWAVVAGAIAFARAQRQTAEKTIAYLTARPLAGKSEAERARIIAGMAERVNRLDFEERQKFRYEGPLRAWFEELTEAERIRYVELTLPRGLQQMMEAFNEMTPAKRKQIVNRALNDLARAREEMPEAPPALSDETLQRIVNEGMKSFLRDASAETKLDLQPVIEQMQQIMQMAR